MGEEKEYRNVFIGKNPDTGRPYFERRRVRKPRPKDPDNVPTVEELPPLGAEGSLSEKRPIIIRNPGTHASHSAEALEKKEN